mmetsp:Transcript_116202/g.301237  ORF Transcript_116202/g.301237 Transcript_116202/m.301237 type:complete len:264 (+) Transcript_116202:67-858(+)
MAGNTEGAELLACEAPGAECSYNMRELAVCAGPGDKRSSGLGRRAAAVSAALVGAAATLLLCVSVLRGSHGQPPIGEAASMDHGPITGAATGAAHAAEQLWGNDMHSCGGQTCDCGWVHSSTGCNRGAYETECGRCCCGGGAVKVVYVEDSPEDYTAVIVLGVLVAALAIFLCWCFCCRKAPAAVKPSPPSPQTVLMPKEERACWLASCLGSGGDGCVAGCPRPQCTAGECIRGPSCTPGSCTMPRCSPPACTTPAISCVFPK